MESHDDNRPEPDLLLHGIRQLLRQDELTRRTHAGGAAVRAREREIEHLREKLAEAVKEDPAGGHDSWGRLREGTHS